MHPTFTIIDADAHHLDGPAYKTYLPEQYRARSGPYFPSFGWDIFLNGTTGRKPANPQEYCKDLDVEKIGDAVAYPSNALAIVSSASSISPQNWRRPTTTGLPISVGRAAIESNTPL